MKNSDWKTYAFWIILCEAVGALAGWISAGGIEVYSALANKPPLTPPQWVFPVVWSILYALMGVSAARISLTPPSKERNRGLNLFTAQLIVNFFWPLLFFNAQAFGFALIWLILLWVLVLVVILIFWKIDKTAAWLLIPYLAWLTFAVYLNAGVYILN
ncbi:MAG: tryptophan-rich sensory protein [Ruminococcaceae bacterium]|nr:tryptophan-rich sensory protein [Oscillospiraceae bacterium]